MSVDLFNQDNINLFTDYLLYTPECKSYIAREDWGGLVNFLMEKAKLPLAIYTLCNNYRFLYHYFQQLDGFNRLERGTYIFDDAFIGDKSLESITIPFNIHFIGSDAFNNCTNLKEVKIEEGLQEIESYAFFHCTSLNKINFPDSLQAIYKGAFAECEELEEVVLPDSLQIIEENVFRYCSGLRKVELSKNLAMILKRSFGGCLNLKSITLPKSLTYIDEGAFDGCDALEEIKYMGTKEQWEKIKRIRFWGPIQGFVIRCTDGDIYL